MRRKPGVGKSEFPTSDELSHQPDTGFQKDVEDLARELMVSSYDHHLSFCESAGAEGEFFQDMMVDAADRAFAAAEIFMKVLWKRRKDWLAKTIVEQRAKQEGRRSASEDIAKVRSILENRSSQ